MMCTLLGIALVTEIIFHVAVIAAIVKYFKG